MEVIRRTGSRLRSGAGALVVTVAVAAAVTGGYLGLHRDTLTGDTGNGPAARSGAAMVYDPATGDMVLFGGIGGTGQPLADTWIWDGSSWSQAAPADSPPARYGAQMAWDPQSQRVILVGGTGGSGCSTGGGVVGIVTASGGTVTASGGACTQLQDAWAWDGSDWAQLSVGDSAGQLGHYTLAGASMATDPATGEIVLVTAGSTVTSIIPIPGIYASSGGAAASSGGAVVNSSGASAVGVSAGSAGTGSSSGSGGTCIGVDGGPCGSPVALPSATAVASPLPTACPLTGGCISLPCPSLPVAQGTAGSAGIACPVPCPVSPCVMCPMTSGGAGAQTGTTTGSGVICSPCTGTGAACPLLPATLTWVFDGSSFHEVAVDASDAPDSGGQLVWFPDPGRLVDLGPDLYAEVGGPAISCPSGAPCPIAPQAEDWYWTGSGWTPAQDLPSGAASPYFDVAPVADSAAGDVVGLDPSGATWVSSDPSSGWTQLTPAATPGARSGFALAYDDATGQVVLFGGDLAGSTSSAGGLAGDTWTWDGSDWTEQEGSAPSSPSPSALPSPVLSPSPSSSPSTSSSQSPSASPSPVPSPSPASAAPLPSPTLQIFVPPSPCDVECPGPPIAVPTTAAASPAVSSLPGTATTTG
jgi:hypothetical protein